MVSQAQHLHGQMEPTPSLLMVAQAVYMLLPGLWLEAQAVRQPVVTSMSQVVRAGLSLTQQQPHHRPVEAQLGSQVLDMRAGPLQPVLQRKRPVVAVLVGRAEHQQVPPLLPPGVVRADLLQALFQGLTQSVLGTQQVMRQVHIRKVCLTLCSGPFGAVRPTQRGYQDPEAEVGVQRSHHKMPVRFVVAEPVIQQEIAGVAV
jgi:hypothetical protein